MNFSGQPEIQHHYMEFNSDRQPAVAPVPYQQSTNDAIPADVRPIVFQQPHDAASASSSAAGKRVRTQFSAEQLIELEKEFARNIYVSKERREELVLQLNLNNKQIKVWFQNKRMKAKREQREAQKSRPKTVPFSPMQSLRRSQQIMLPNVQQQPLAQLPYPQVLHPQIVPSTYVDRQPSQGLMLPSAPPQGPLMPLSCLQVKPMQQFSLQPENWAYGLPQQYQVPGQWVPPQQGNPCYPARLEPAAPQASSYDQDFSDLFEVLENICG